MDEFYRAFARRAASHYQGFRQDAQERDDVDTLAYAKNMRRLLNLAADDIANLLNIIEALSGERFKRDA